MPLCRQLGLELVGLSPELPLFCGVTGARISEEQDKRMEVLRDALMDAARSRVEEMGEDAVAGWKLTISDSNNTIRIIIVMSTFLEITLNLALTVTRERLSCLKETR